MATTKPTNDVERLLQELRELGDRTRRGPFHCLTITADGRARVSWMNHAEDFRVQDVMKILTREKPETTTGKVER